MEQILLPHETKTFIGFLDILITGRIHAAVAALSQAIPTVIIDYGHEPKAHKLKGFAKVAMVENFVVEPTSFEGIREGIKGCWQSRDLIKVQLKGRMKEIRVLAKSNFELLKSL